MNGWIINVIVTTSIIMVVILLLGFSYQTTILLEIIATTVILFACAALYQLNKKIAPSSLRTQPIAKKTTETITISEISLKPTSIEIQESSTTTETVQETKSIASSSRFKDVFSTHQTFSTLLQDNSEVALVEQEVAKVEEIEPEHTPEEISTYHDDTSETTPSTGNLQPIRRKIIKNILTPSTPEPSKQFNNNIYNRYEILD